MLPVIAPAPSSVTTPSRKPPVVTVTPSSYFAVALKRAAETAMRFCFRPAAINHDEPGLLCLVRRTPDGALRLPCFRTWLGVIEWRRRSGRGFRYSLLACHSRGVGARGQRGYQGRGGHDSPASFHQYAPTGFSMTFTVRHMMIRSPKTDQFST